MKNVAILYQAKPPPKKNGVQKPMKPGGYSDSGADIAFELLKNGIKVAIPLDKPNIEKDKEWVFPDTKEGIENAIQKGADTFWLNTVLYKNHDIEGFYGRGFRFIGQMPEQVDIYDDKYYTNELLRKNKIPIPQTQLILEENLGNYTLELEFPLVVKPIRGRGSQGVSMVLNKEELDAKLSQLYSEKVYGTTVYVEEFLEGHEITVTVMPAGIYNIDNQEKVYKRPWCLPAVKRVNHIDGIAPYSGIVAVMENSFVLDDIELKSKEIFEVYSHCQKTAQLLEIKAPIRVDCRANNEGEYVLFDVNMKPNMTGPSRPHRQSQDSLTLLAARKIGWSYIHLLMNILSQAWKT